MKSQKQLELEMLRIDVEGMKIKGQSVGLSNLEFERLKTLLERIQELETELN